MFFNSVFLKAIVFLLGPNEIFNVKARDGKISHIGSLMQGLKCAGEHRSVDVTARNNGNHSVMIQRVGVE